MGINMNWTGIDHRTHSYHVSDRLIQYPAQLCRQTTKLCCVVERSSLLSLENKSIPLPLPPTPGYLKERARPLAILWAPIETMGADYCKGLATCRILRPTIRLATCPILLQPDSSYSCRVGGESRITYSCSHPGPMLRIEDSETPYPTILCMRGP